MIFDGINAFSVLTDSKGVINKDTKYWPYLQCQRELRNDNLGYGALKIKPLANDLSLMTDWKTGIRYKQNCTYTGGGTNLFNKGAESEFQEML